MTWVAAGILAVGVLVAAAFAGLGRFGEMPQHPVTDRPRGRVPEGPVTERFLADLQLPRAASGYERSAVDQYLREIADGTAVPADEKRFKVVSEGYDMLVVDDILARERYERPTAADAAFTRPGSEDPTPEEEVAEGDGAVEETVVEEPLEPVEPKRAD